MTVDLAVRRPPARLPLSHRVRLGVGGAAGAAAALLSRLAGRGSGASIQGRVLLTVAPTAFEDTLAGRTIVAVSGTNGKTTTTHLLAAAVRASLVDPTRVVTNADGANLYHGIASALVDAPRSDIAVLETDERVVPSLIQHGRPDVLVLLNFSRDQMDRNHEIAALGRGWRTALAAAGDEGPVVVANADDPLVTWAAQAAREVVWVDTATRWNQDSALCPGCGTVLARTPGTDGRVGWRCPGCGLSKPAATWFALPDEDGGSVRSPGGTWALRLRVPGRFNVANAACALAAAAQWGVDVPTALSGMRTVVSPAGRYATTTIGTSTARLLLAKNPAGWAESLPLAQSDPVILAIDSAAADGRDVSWLWDVDYEQLAGRHVIATGPRAQDLAVRLLYAGVSHTVVPDLAEALDGHPDPVDVVSTYTPFQRLRKLGGLA